MIRRLASIAAAVLAAAVLAPVAAAALPRVELSTDIAPGRLSWKTSGMLDLDQVRATTLEVPGLPGDGTQYCGPTTAVDLLAYLARAGFRTGIDGATDFAAPENYNAATLAIRSMGAEMPTSATGGTGVLEFVSTFERHLGRGAAAGTLHADGGSYRSSDREPPTPVELAEIGLDGAVVAAIVIHSMAFIFMTARSTSAPAGTSPPSPGSRRCGPTPRPSSRSPTRGPHPSSTRRSRRSSSSPTA